MNNNKDIKEFNEKNTPKWLKDKLVPEEKLNELAKKCKKCEEIYNNNISEELSICKCGHLYVDGEWNDHICNHR